MGFFSKFKTQDLVIRSKKFDIFGNNYTIMFNSIYKGGEISYFEKIMLIYSVLHTLIVDCSKKGIRNFKAFYEVNHTSTILVSIIWV